MLLEVFCNPPRLYLIFCSFQSTTKDQSCLLCFVHKIFVASLNCHYCTLEKCVQIRSECEITTDCEKWIISFPLATSDSWKKKLNKRKRREKEVQSVRHGSLSIMLQKCCPDFITVTLANAIKLYSSSLTSFISCASVAGVVIKLTQERNQRQNFSLAVRRVVVVAGLVNTNPSGGLHASACDLIMKWKIPGVTNGERPALYSRSFAGR